MTTLTKDCYNIIQNIINEPFRCKLKDSYIEISINLLKFKLTFDLSLSDIETDPLEIYPYEDIFVEPYEFISYNITSRCPANCIYFTTNSGNVYYIMKIELGDSYKFEIELTSEQAYKFLKTYYNCIKRIYDKN